MKLTRIKGRHKLRLYRYESHPIATMYGLAVDAENDEHGEEVDVAVPFFSMSASFDFVLEKGRVVFDFLAQRAPQVAESVAPESSSA